METKSTDRKQEN